MVEVVNVIECCSNWFTDESVLKKFISGCENPLFYAEDASKIIDAFKRLRCQ